MTMDPGNAPRPAGFRWLQTIAVVVGLLVVVGAVCAVVSVYSRPKPFELPFAAREVAHMQVRGFHLDGKGGETTFQVLPPYWERILSVFSPAYEYDDGAKWTVDGTLNLEMKDGSPYCIMYSDADQFAAGPTQNKRVYCRGADRAALKKALAGAYEASKTKP
jgi:hypothetical protein